MGGGVQSKLSDNNANELDPENLVSPSSTSPLHAISEKCGPDCQLASPPLSASTIASDSVVMIMTMNNHRDGVFYDHASKAVTGTDFIVVPMGMTIVTTEKTNSNLTVIPAERNADLGNYVYFVENCAQIRS